MCGIFGVLRRGPIEPNADLIREALRAQAHRGPDGQGLIVERFPGGTLTLAHQRLSIIDLTDAAAQPMSYRDGRGWLTYNGELYNYLELRTDLACAGEQFRTRSDTEVLLAALHRWGPLRALERFNWMGAFAWYDRQTQRLVLACDSGSEKPLYHYMDERQLVFASEIKALLPLVGRRLALDREVIGRFLFQGLADTSPETMFRGVTRLPPGTFAVLDLAGGELRVEPQSYTAPEYAGEPRAMPLPAFEDELRRLLVDSVRLRLRSDVPVGVLLSGGIDSSAIAAICQSIAGLDATPRLLSVVSEDPRFDESVHIAVMERHLGRSADKVTLQADPARIVDDVSVVNWYNDAPVTGLSAVGHFKLMELARQLGVKVILSGQGADEILLGYRKFLGFYLQSLLRRRRIGAALAVLARFVLNGTVLTQFSMADAKRYLPFRIGSAAVHRADGTAIEGEWLRGWKPIDLGLGAGTLEQRQLEDVRRLSVPSLCHYEDRMSMAMGREIRLPFLDTRLVSFLLRAPADYKLRAGWTKYSLRKAMEPMLPPAICWRKDKQGFSNPQGEWLKEELREQVREALGPDSLIARKGIVSSASLLQKYERYRQQPAGRGSIWYREIFAPFSLELWMRRYEQWLV
jgi:asparagine synthase (glutamine-hydrolysing)